MINKLIASSVSVFPKWFIELFSKSYVAGYNSNEVLSIVEKLNGQGFSATIDIPVSYTHLTLPTILRV